MATEPAEMAGPEMSCSYTAQSGSDGGASVTLTVPTSRGPARFTVTAARHGVRSWLVTLPSEDGVVRGGTVLLLGPPS